MGFLKNLFGKSKECDNTQQKYDSDPQITEKKEKVTKSQTNNPVVKVQEDLTDDYILNETFQGISPVTDERNKQICNRFVAQGIIEYSDNRFDDSSLGELSFDEFCHIYSTVGWYANNVTSGITQKAVAYKRFLRKKLLSRLTTFSVYTIYANVNNLPFVLQDGSMLLYTSKEFAIAEISKAGLEWIELHEIKPEEFEIKFCEYICAGFTSVNINRRTIVGINDVCSGKSLDSFGNVCVESCTRMVDYKQTQAMMISAAKGSGRSLDQEEISILNKQSWGVSQSLLKDNLLVPANMYNGVLKGFSFPSVLFPDGEKFLGLFTDQWAINGYFRKSTPSVSFPDLIKDSYKEIAIDPSIAGILINPGREEYKMTKEMLSQLFAGTAE